MPSNQRGASAVISALQAAGVRNIFTLSGNQIMPLFDASIGAGIRLVHVRHEAAAVHMADTWGRLTEQPGVALVTAGPGMANCLSALYVARMAESPLVLLSGHSPIGRHALGAFQEMAQAEMALPVAKASWTVTNANSLSGEIARALQIAGHGRPGPVHLSLPFDLLEAPAIQDDQTGQIDHPRDLLTPDQSTRILTELARATRPLILTGPSLMRGQPAELLRTLESITSIPVIGMESPRGVNDPSLGALAEVLSQADLLLLWGKKLDFTLRLNNKPAYDSECRILQVDPEQEFLDLTNRVLGDAAPSQLALRADTRASCDRLVEAARQLTWNTSGWLSEVHSAVSYRPATWDGLQAHQADRLHPVQVCRATQRYLDGATGSIFISDGGEFGQWAQACVRAPLRVINGTAGSIGGAIPFALAARLAYPEARIVTALGDGTFGFHAMEFDTAVRCELPFIAVLGNDAFWNAEYQIQLRKYGLDRAVGCDLLPTRYDQLVSAIGGYGEHIKTERELGPALERAHNSELPSCLNASLENAAAPVIRRDPQQ